ncbi:MAG: tRNA (adenosine(37)-N6)-threonylcarbamoyltransferase complex dimerization subunit type 1 TsaB [Rhodospirillales bacterium]|nr:tRNA (adenosine(37)-N6)-threonylcarbamoyltransferase complex dimerization subunit type 1 TsaB [Rhodospirillales bacterium]
MSIILAFDTSMAACSAALCLSETGETLAAGHEPMQRGQAERLLPLIDELVKEAGLEFQNISLLSCTRGPGAFTGLRLSMATAKALSLSLNIPAIGISTLAAISATYRVSSCASETQKILTCLETKRKDYYTQLFDPFGRAVTPAACSTLRDVMQMITSDTSVIIGDAAQRLQKETGLESKMFVDIPYPDCMQIARLALEAYTPDKGRLQEMSPLYLRDADVSFPATKK